MNFTKMLGQYEKTRTQTSGKMDLIILCYEKAIQCLHLAKTFFTDGEYEKKARMMQKAMDIIGELQASLDYEKGGQIATNLSALYNYINRRLLQGDINKEVGAYDEAIRIMSELKEAWEGIASQNVYDTNPNTVPKVLKTDSNQIAALG